MPVDIIRRLLSELEAKATAEKAVSDVIRSRDEAIENQNKEAQEKIDVEIRDQVNKLLSEAQILDKFKKVGGEFLKTESIRHETGVHYNGDYTGTAFLVWGSDFTVNRDNGHGYIYHWTQGVDGNYSEITATINLKDKRLTIRGSVVEALIDRTQFRNRELVDNAIANAFLHPTSRYYSPPGYGNDGPN